MKVTFNENRAPCLGHLDCIFLLHCRPRLLLQIQYNSFTPGTQSLNGHHDDERVCRFEAVVCACLTYSASSRLRKPISAIPAHARLLTSVDRVNNLPSTSCGFREIAHLLFSVIRLFARHFSLSGKVLPSKHLSHARNFLKHSFVCEIDIEALQYIHMLLHSLSTGIGALHPHTPPFPFN